MVDKTRLNMEKFVWNSQGTSTGFQFSILIQLVGIYLWYRISPLEMPHEGKSHLAGWWTSNRLETKRSRNNPTSKVIVSLDLWNVTPSCWIYNWCQNNFWSKFRYLSPLTVNLLRVVYYEIKKGPKMMPNQKRNYTVAL